jgi:hypothetical protein
MVPPSHHQICRLYTINVRKVLHHSTLDLAGTSKTLKRAIAGHIISRKSHGQTVWTIQPPRCP